MHSTTQTVIDHFCCNGLIPLYILFDWFSHFQLVFTTVGLLVSNLLWSHVRGDSVDNSLDTNALSNFILSDQNAANSVALGVGYVS